MGLPAGVTPAMVWAVLIPVCIVTVALRALPFSFLKLLKGSPFIEFLGVYMPVGVMTVLVVYTIGGAVESPGGAAAALIASALTLGLHAWRRSPGLSIFTGTLAYMTLVNLVF
ncbi:branched-chain amino acid transport protein [Corynebacterium imitans]|uniref:Branched-chain amino acid ABC transporter permease n=1 Tax=Corynebacterium imitans TaxID=156978 RepID=A0A076NMG7_9CORY|nr:AzlD domain-containing protein [Corynebacterium imitans]AIJ34518.1 branched-chain amino acid ABC transporter permease [Corynebacterium imitans]SNV52397.1 branched-chain amino acid transport protein [Corynebacterium imitans]